MKIRLIHKILGGFTVVLVLMAIVATMGIMQLNKASARTAAMYRENVLGVEYALETDTSMIASAREEKRAFLTNDQTKRQSLIAQSRDDLKHAEASSLAYHDTFASDADAAQWLPIEQQVKKVAAARLEVLALLEKNLDAEATVKATAMEADIASMNRALDESAKFNA